MIQSKNVYKWAKLFKESRNSIEDKNKPCKPKMSCQPEMVYLVNVLILSNGRFRIEDIYEQPGNFVDTAHKIMRDDLAFSKVNCR